MKFWDTSAVVPLCVQEPNSATVREILAEDPSMVVWWGTRTDERAARHVLHTLMQTWAEMQPSEALRNTAERLLAVHPLRAADALQLAAAILWCQGLTTGQGFVSFDQRLCNVGYREGFTVLPEAF